MKKSFLVFSLTCFCFANTMYLNKDVDIKVDGKKVANASLLSPVKVLEKKDKSYKVELIGYINDNYQEELVKNFNQNENYASFHDENENATYKSDKNPYLKILDKVEDDYGEIWHKASISFEVNESDLDSSVEALHKEAKSLYEQTCSPCHQLHSTKEYTVSQWPSNLESMISSDYVALEKDEKALIIKYLQQNAKDIN